MQKTATKIFIIASIVFGIVGIALVLVTGPQGDNAPLNQVLLKILQITALIILPSFALSVAGKYLGAGK
jgi:hypothetical protein